MLVRSTVCKTIIHITIKWEDHLKNQQLYWPNIFKASLNTTVDTKLREFQYKYLKYTEFHTIDLCLNVNLNPIIFATFGACALTQINICFGNAM